MLEKAKEKWTEDFPRVLLAYRATKKSVTIVSPFLIVYGAKDFIQFYVNDLD